MEAAFGPGPGPWPQTWGFPTGHRLRGYTGRAPCGSWLWLWLRPSGWDPCSPSLPAGSARPRASAAGQGYLGVGGTVDDGPAQDSSGLGHPPAAESQDPMRVDLSWDSHVGHLLARPGPGAVQLDQGFRKSRRDWAVTGSPTCSWPRASGLGVRETLHDIRGTDGSTCTLGSIWHSGSLGHVFAGAYDVLTRGSVLPAGA